MAEINTIKSINSNYIINNSNIAANKLSNLFDTNSTVKITNLSGSANICLNNTRLYTDDSRIVSISGKSNIYNFPKITSNIKNGNNIYDLGIYDITGRKE